MGRNVQVYKTDDGKLYLNGYLVSENVDELTYERLKVIINEALPDDTSTHFEELHEDDTSSNLNFTYAIDYSKGMNRAERRHKANYEATRYKRPKKNRKDYF